MWALPQVEALQEAVEHVIDSNQRDGYVPTRFIQVTQRGAAPGLKQVCELLIIRGETLEYLEKALQQFPTLLTLEDFVLRHGRGWGLFRPGNSHCRGAGRLL